MTTADHHAKMGAVVREQAHLTGTTIPPKGKIMTAASATGVRSQFLRRDFLKLAAGAVAAPYFIPSGVLAAGSCS